MPYKDPEARKQAYRDHYVANKPNYKERNRRRRDEDNQWLDALKAKPCADCGGSYPPYVMDFHHRDPSTKYRNVSRLVARGSRRRLEEEVAKCDLVCANCHRIRTYCATH